MNAVQEKQKLMILPGKKEVLSGPWINFSMFHNQELTIGIKVLNPGEGERAWREEWFTKTVKILKIELPNNYYGVAIPKVEVFAKDLWTKQLRRAVEVELRKSRVGEEAVNFVCRRLKENTEELSLANGMTVVGDFEFDMVSGDSKKCFMAQDMLVYGRLKDPEPETEPRIELFRIKHLHEWSLVCDANSGIKRNMEIWNKNVEYLVIQYVNELIPFTSPLLRKKISQAIKRVSLSTEWAKQCRQTHLQLKSISLENQVDPRLTRAFRLIKEVAEEK